MTSLDYIRKIEELYVYEDGNSIAKYANKYSDSPIQYIKSKLTAEDSQYGDDNNSIFIKVSSIFRCKGNRIKFIWGYTVEDIDEDDFATILLSNSKQSTFTSMTDLGKELADAVNKSIMSSTYQTTHRSQKIFAAEDDFEYSEESFGDTLDNVADTVEDMQDTLEDIQEDDANIEIDNNISDHYIVECDRCKGIFISAIVESDQKIDKISGVCPLCEKESDQYIKWVIRDVNED